MSDTGKDDAYSTASAAATAAIASLLTYADLALSKEGPVEAVVKRESTHCQEIENSTLFSPRFLFLLSTFSQLSDQSSPDFRCMQRPNSMFLPVLIIT